MIQRTDIILDNSGRDNAGAAVTGAFDGDWYAFQADGRSQGIVAVKLVSGTGTIAIEGRNGPLSPATQIFTTTSSDSLLVGQFKQYRARISSGAAAVVLVTVDRIGKKV